MVSEGSLGDGTQGQPWVAWIKMNKKLWVILWIYVSIYIYIYILIGSLLVGVVDG